MSFQHTRCPTCGERYLRPDGADPGCPKGCRPIVPVLPGQLSLLADTRTRAVHMKVEPYDVYAGRPRGGVDPRKIPIGQTGWLGNPWDVREFGDALERYRAYFHERLASDPAFRASVLALKGKKLGCFCKPARCHADLIAAWVEAQG